MVIFGLEKSELVLNRFLKGEDLIIFSLGMNFLGMISTITGQGQICKKQIVQSPLSEEMLTKVQGNSFPAVNEFVDTFDKEIRSSDSTIEVLTAWIDLP